MKFNWNFRFQGPPTLSLHHLTAFDESDSMTIGRFRIFLKDIDIWIALYMARISAEFISIGGTGFENKHIKCPSQFRRTPPMAAVERDWQNDASTFHLTHPFGGEIQREDCLGTFGKLTTFRNPDQLRQGGFLTTSSREYGKFVSQPFSHQLRRTRIRSCNCVTEHEMLLKTREFRSFQIDHIMMGKMAHQILRKKGDGLMKTHWTNASFKDDGKTQFKFQIQSHQLHICHEKEHCSRRWSVLSMYN